jgi:putative ABC transport system permease protein
MDSILNDLRFAVRSLLRRPGFTIAALLTLGLGIGATTAIFSIVQNVLLRPLPYDEPDRLVVIGQAFRTAASGAGSSVSTLNFEDVRAQSRGFAAMAQYTNATATVSGDFDAEMVPAASVTRPFFGVLRAEPLLGRTFTPEEDRPGGPFAVVLSYEYWQDRLGGAPDVLQRTLTIGSIPRPIVGVMRPGFAFPRGARLYLPARPDTESCGRGCIYLTGLARLDADATLAGVRVELATISQRLEAEYPESNRDREIRAAPLMDVIVGDMRRALYVMLGAVGMVLLIACANVANLLLVRGSARSGEFAVRTVLGAGRSRIVAQLMTENVVLALIGGGLGVVFAIWGVDLLRAVAPPNLPRIDEIALDATAIAFAGLLVIVTAVLFGLAPALHVTRASLAETLRGTGRGDAGGGWGRFAVLVTQVALAVVLLLGTGLMIRSLVGMQRVETGFDSRNVAHFSISLPGRSYDAPEKNIAFMDELKQRVAALPGVASVGLVMPMPLSSNVYATSLLRTDVETEAGAEPIALLRVADGNGLDVLGVQLIRGRGFDADDRDGAPRVALINRTAAEQIWPGEEPIGRQVEVGVSFEYEEDQPRTIVGVVEDIRALSLREPARAEVIVPYAQSVPGSAALVVRTASAGAFLSAARAEVRALDPSLPMLWPGTTEELVAAQLAPSRFFLLLLAVFAALAVTLAAIGIYGVVAFAVSRRGREIGVRLALGARIQQVIGLVVWQGMRPALLGLALGLAGAFISARLMGGMLFDVAPHDPVTYLGVTVVLLFVVVMACAVPAGRAGRIPPASSLRTD